MQAADMTVLTGRKMFVGNEPVPSWDVDGNLFLKQVKFVKDNRDNLLFSDVISLLLA